MEILKKKLFLLILVTFCLFGKVLTQEQQIQEEVPETFGLITVTHTRAGDNSQFMKYLDRYATMDCPIVKQINIVWNNQQSMQQMGIYQKKNQWKRAVNFYRTPNNSMNWRFKIAKQTTSQVFFSIDDDITVDCQELKRGFQIWQKNAIGSIAPIVSYGPRYYEYTLKQGFQYGKGKTKNVFNIGLVGLAFISRHFMDLYYTNLFQIKQMRDYVVQKNNCDDIGLNWVIEYYYPELKTITIDGNIQNISPRVAQATGKTHYPYRTQCIQKFTQIFGVNSLRYVPLNDGYPGKQKRMLPLMKETVLAKKAFLQNFVIYNNGQSIVNKIGSMFQAANQKQVEDDKQVVQAQKNQPQKDKPQSDSPKLLEYQRIITKLKSDVDALSSQLQQQKKKYLQNCNSKKSEQTDKQQQAIKLSQQLRYSLYIRSYIQLFLVVVILFLLWRCLQNSKQKNPSSRRIKLQSSQIDY